MITVMNSNKIFTPFRNRNRNRNRNDLAGILLRTLIVPLLLAIYIWADTVNAQQQQTTNTTTADIDIDIVSGSGNGNGNNEVVPINTSATASDYILFPWFVQLLGCLSMFILTRFSLPIPYAAVMFILGALMGIVATNLDDNDGYDGVDSDAITGSSSSQYRNYLQDSITQWINIDSDLLLLVFLPGLIFKDAVEIPINLFLVASGMLYYVMLFYKTFARLA